MRYIDIALAGLIGLSAISSLAVVTPRSGDAAAHRSAVQAQLSGALVGLLEEKGVVWFMRSSPGEICTGLLAASNSTVKFSAVGGSLDCGAPPSGSVGANISLPIRPARLVLEAWSRDAP